MKCMLSLKTAALTLVFGDSIYFPSLFYFEFRLLSYHFKHAIQFFSVSKIVILSTTELRDKYARYQCQ